MRKSRSESAEFRSGASRQASRRRFLTLHNEASAERSCEPPKLYSCAKIVFIAESALL